MSVSRGHLTDEEGADEDVYPAALTDRDASDPADMRQLKAALESKNSRLMGLENVVRQLEAENQTLRHQRPEGSYPSLVLFRSSFFSKLGNFFFLMTVLIFGLHVSGVVRIEQLFREAEGVLASVLSLFA